MMKIIFSTVILFLLGEDTSLFRSIFMSNVLLALYPLMGRSESLEWWSLFWFRAAVNGRIYPWIIAQDLVITKRGKRVTLNFSQW